MMDDTLWSAWGDPRHLPVLPAATVAWLGATLGPGRPPDDVGLASLVAGVPPSRLPVDPLVCTEPDDRVRHARGQSLPDLIALRGGRVPTWPDGVAFPATEAMVRRVIAYAAEVGARLIPFGGGTSVVGQLTPLRDDAPVLIVDLRRLTGLIEFDEISGLATFGAGITGPDLEAYLRARGFILGHFPQSFERSTLGGWVATRSSGHYSLGYGRIERLFAGGRLETPAGTLDLPSFPASAAGPDLREMVLGSEGRLGILTRATVRVTPMPEREEIIAVFFPDWEAGLAAVRAMVQARLPLLMLRYSTPTETATTLALAGQARLIGMLERALGWRGVGAEKALLLLGVGGHAGLTAAVRAAALGIAGRHGGVSTGGLLGHQWRRQRFRTPALRDTLWRLGYAADTLETAIDWARLPGLLAAIEGVLRHGLAESGERVYPFTHLSHLYPDGSSLYTTFLFRLAPDPDETLRRWQTLKTAASEAIVAHGGTISHQHGVGLGHRPYLPAEKGPLGMAAMRALGAHFDPTGMMNPGKLFE